MSKTAQESDVEGDVPNVRVNAEWDPLRAVRLHRPGLETYVGTLDPDPNLFLDQFSLLKAQKEHESLVGDLRESLDFEDSVHYLHEDLDNKEAMDVLLSSRVDFDLSEVNEDTRLSQQDALWSRIHGLDPHSKLQAIATNATVKRNVPENGDQGFNGSNPARRLTTSVTLEKPLSNLYFQRDSQFVSQAGVVLCSMRKNTRQPEIEIARAAWEALDGEFDVDIVADLSRVQEHDVTEHVPERDDIESTDVYVEGGDYMPAGDFSLLGVSADVSDVTYPTCGVEEEDTELVLRTTYAAGHRLLMDGGFGAPEVGLVRAPYRAARERAGSGEADMDIMHLDTWFNFVDDDLVVAHEELVDNTTLDIYERTGEEGHPYELARPNVNFGSYIRDEKGFEIADAVSLVDHEHEDANAALKAITNFLTLGPRKILPVRFEHSDDDVMTRFIERMKDDYGVEVVPDGEGRKIKNLRGGYGAVHCMTTPIRRV